jgi:hypothetical protein
VVPGIFSKILYLQLGLDETLDGTKCSSSSSSSVLNECSCEGGTWHSVRAYRASSSLYRVRRAAAAAAARGGTYLRS